MVDIDNAKEQLKQLLRMDKFRDSVAAKAKSLKEKAKIEIKK